MRAFGSAGEISVWEVYQYFYCRRKLYFIRKLGLYPPERKKMQMGSEAHYREYTREKRRKEVYSLPREEIEEVLGNIPLEDKELGFFGRADTVLRLKSGEFIPVDVKFSNLSFVSLAWRKQMVAYTTLLEKRLGTKIKRGLIYLLPSKRVMWVNITQEDKLALAQDLKKMKELIDSDTLPPRASPEKCEYCEVKKFCKRF